MFCRTYSILTVICITCLFIFTTMDSDPSDRRYMLLNRHVEFENNDGVSLFSLVDSKLPSDNALTHLTDKESRQRMDNNNSSFENTMGSQEEKTKGQTPSVEEVNADGQFSGQFNIQLLNEHLKRCIRDGDGEVDMDEYIKIFQQLYKFFCMLGTVFGFIGSDVKSKIEILQAHRSGENGTHYETVEKMIEYEKTSDYIHSNKESSGSRTFLRLHRSLIFVSIFLGKMDSIEDQDGTSRICKDAYAQTLAKFHPWLIQKGAGIAMLGLPTKKDLIHKVCANGITFEGDEVITLMHDVIRRTREIYDTCEELYTKHDLHALP